MLLTEIEGHPAAARAKREVTPEEAEREAAEREKMAVREAAAEARKLAKQREKEEAAAQAAEAAAQAKAKEEKQAAERAKRLERAPRDEAKEGAAGKTGKAPAAKKAKTAAKEEEGGGEEEEGESSPPEVDERFFVPASLWPNEKSKKTAHGKGWLASVVRVAPAGRAGKKKKGDELVVHFVCDGEKEPVSMAMDAFRANCKSIGKA